MGSVLQEDSLTTQEMVDEEADYIDSVKENTVSSFDIDTTTTVIARKCLCPAPDDVRMAVESNVYEGIKSNILQKREYFIDWTCDYNLLFYPFDTQVCSMLHKSITYKMTDQRLSFIYPSILQRCAR